MFKKLFGLGSKTNEETIVAPLTGAVKILKKYQIQYLLVV